MSSKFFMEEKISTVNVLLLNFRGLLKEALVKIFKENNCKVVETISTGNNLRFSYIFLANSLRDIAKSLNLSSKNNSKFIFVITEENQKIYKKSVDLILKINPSIDYYIIKIKNASSEEEATKIADGILSKVFSYRDLNESQALIKTRGNKVFAKIKESKSIKKSENKPNFFKSPYIIFLFFLFFIIFTLSIYIFSIYISFSMGVKKLDTAISAFSKGDIETAKSNTDQSVKLLSFGSSISKITTPIIKLLDSSEGSTIENGFNTALLLAKSASQLVYVAKLGQEIGNSVVSSRTSLHISQIEKLNSEMKDLKNKISLLLVYIKKLKEDDSDLYKYFDVEKKLIKGEETLKEVDGLIEIAERFSRILPNILGYDKPKTFLLLFQNNSELRPTGGFIGSFGWIILSEGRLIEFRTEDVYTADGQLKGHIPPPEPIKKYLNQENWYLRDSNFDPDFATSAEQAEWFLKHEMNLSFDGVFAFDLNSVEEVLKAIDGVYLPDYKENITAQNLFLKTQSNVESDFFPGSTQKKDFLGNLSRAIFIKVTSGDISWTKILKGLKQSLDQKHILLYAHDEDAQRLIEQSNWGGRIGSISCVGISCISDYLMIVEANMGINKANFLINRDAKLSLVQKENSLDHHLTVNYTNESSDTAYPGGSYFSYTRILLPSESVYQQILVDGIKIDEKDVKIDKYQDKKSVEFPFRVDAKSKRKLELFYNLPINYNKNPSIELYIQKQPGIKPYALEINLLQNNKQNTKKIDVAADQVVSFMAN